MKGKVLCTEGRAKSIIAIVSILCLVVTATTPFEYQLVFKDDCIKTCDEEDLQKLQPKRASEIRQELEMAEKFTLPLDLLPAAEDMFQKNCTKTFTEDADVDTPTEISIRVNEESLLLFTNSTQKLYDAIVNIVLLNTTCCVKNYTIETEETSLAKNKTYKSVFYWFSAICFGVLPLGMIATFNCFLISAVYRSHRKRKVMTNSQVIIVGDSVKFPLNVRYFVGEEVPISRKPDNCSINRSYHFIPNMPNTNCVLSNLRSFSGN